MKVSEFGRFALCRCIVAALVAGCSGSQPIAGAGETGQGPALAQRSRGVVSLSAGSLVKGGFGCDWAGAVESAAPCPVKLKEKNHTTGVTVTITAKDYAYIELYINECDSICSVEQLDRTQWLVTGGSACGRAELEWNAYNASGEAIGYAYVPAVNKYCPGS
jgi:hypothetical protein